MFLAGTIGVVIGGPIAILVYSQIDPTVVGGEGAEAAWRGMATIAGSWIGGGANQAAMYEIFEYNPDKFGGMVLVDIVIANIWMAIILIGIGKRDRINKWLKADTSAIEELKEKGIPTTGRENYGGPVVTAGGLIFIAATADGKFRAINNIALIPSNV